jgi:hypothetical protein
MAPNTAKKKTTTAPARTAGAKPERKPAAAKAVAAKPEVKEPKKAAKPAAKRPGDQPDPPRPVSPVSRAMMAFDDDDVLPSGGSAQGIGYGRCGGRMLSSKIERILCDLLSREGVTHSHHPRHFEVQMEAGSMAAYAPMIVVRGRGREGKTIVIESVDTIDANLLDKVRAFRRQYGLEFYVSFVASEDILDDIPVDAYDESTEVQNAAALVSRMAD